MSVCLHVVMVAQGSNIQTFTKLMEMLLIFCVCFHLLTPGSDAALTTPPSNRAVLLGTSRVVMSCASDYGYQSISWRFVPVGGSSAVVIASGSTVFGEQSQSYAVEQTGSQQSNLIILSAIMARAGSYSCLDITPQQAFAQLVIINSDPVCSMTPNAPTELLYNQAVQMSCSISYTANTSYVAVDMIWSKGNPATAVNSPTPQYTTAGNLTTAVSNITQVPGNFTPFPIFSCNTSFKVTGNPPGSANNAPDYSKSTQLFSSPINVIYLKPADANSISGAQGGRVQLGSTVTCNVDANPAPSYSWLDVTLGNRTNTSSIQIWHSGVYQCTTWNKVASTSTSINVTTYITTSPSSPTAVTTTTSTTSTALTPSKSIISGSGTGGGLSDGGKVGIGIGIGVGGTLVLVGILFVVLCRRYEWTKRIKTGSRVKEENSERSGTNTESSNTPQYEPLNILSAQNSNAGPTYAQLTTSTNVDVSEQDLPDRATYENLGYKLEANESHSTEYEGLQVRELKPSDAYESIKPKQ